MIIGDPRDTWYLLYGASEIRSFQNMTVLWANCTDLTRQMLNNFPFDLILEPISNILKLLF